MRSAKKRSQLGRLTIYVHHPGNIRDGEHKIILFSRKHHYLKIDNDEETNYTVRSSRTCLRGPP